VNESEFVGVVDRLLEVGVPPTAIAKAFEIDPFVVRDRATELRVERYGSAELSEALANLQWEAFEQAKTMIYDAPYSVRTRFIMAILSKTMSLTARQNPETIGNLRQNVLDLMGQMTGGGDDDDLAVQDPDAFVASTAADEDQNQGSDD
jgi:regulator of extracellular matrix RemA (YlzA/DUF370 family)